MDDLAETLGMSKKTLYKCYPSKEALINRLMEHTMAEARGTLSAIKRSDGDFVEKIESLLSVLAFHAARISRTFIRDLQRHSPELWRKIETFRQDRIKEIFLRLITQGIKEGYVNPNLNSRIFFHAYIGAINSLVNPSVLSVESFSAQDAIKGVLEMFFKGVLTDEGRSRLSSLEHSHRTHHK
jgi:AcrR family transcriptional regulator